MTPHLRRLDETVLMMGHKIYFYGEIWLIAVIHSYLVQCMEKDEKIEADRVPSNAGVLFQLNAQK